MTIFRLSVFFFFVYLGLILLLAAITIAFETFFSISIPSTPITIAALLGACIFSASRYIRRNDGVAPSSKQLWRIAFALTLADILATALLSPFALLSAELNPFTDPTVITIILVVVALLLVFHLLMIRYFFGMGVKQELARIAREQTETF